VTRLAPAAVFVLVIALAFLLWPDPAPPGAGPKITVSGSVRNGAGEPVVGADAVVRAEIDGNWRRTSTLTDESGDWRVELPGTDRAAVTVEVIADGHRSETRQATADPEAEFTVVLTAWGEVRGTARFTRIRPQFIGAERAAKAGDVWRTLDLVEEGGEGGFRIVNVEPGPCLLRFRLWGWHTPPREAEIPEGGVLSLGELLFPTGGRVEGRVLDAAGLPLERAKVRVKGFEPEFTTREGGRYRFQHVPPGRRTLHVRDAEATREMEVEVEVLDNKALEWELQFPK
jgi:hypothetical protein